MAIYPSAIKTFDTYVDNFDWNDAADLNSLGDEVTAIQTELGADVAGASTNLVTRLGLMDTEMIGILNAGNATTSTLAGTLTLTDASNSTLYLNPNAANRDVNLPAEVAANHLFLIVNTSATVGQTLTIKDDTPTTLAVIDAGEIVLAVSNGTAWKVLRDGNKLKETGFTFIIGSGSAVISTGAVGPIEIPFDCVITGVTLLSKLSGSIVIDVWKDTYANFPPTVADTITAAAKPTLASAQAYQDTTLTGWTTTLTKGDMLMFNVDSVTTCTEVTLAIRVRRV